MTCRKFTVWFLFLLITPNLLAHPHLFIENHVTIVFDQNGLAGFQYRWVFDEISGASYIMDYDSDQDGSFSGKELAILKSEAFDNLRDYNYMSHVEIDGKTFIVKYTTDFLASIEDNKLVYRFFIPCHVKAISSSKKIILSVYDDSFFVDFSLQRDTFGFVNNASFQVKHRIFQNTQKSYYFDQLHPIEIELIFSK